jgi:hypothetical protein
VSLNQPLINDDPLPLPGSVAKVTGHELMIWFIQKHSGYVHSRWRVSTLFFYISLNNFILRTIFFGNYLLDTGAVHFLVLMQTFSDFSFKNYYRTEESVEEIFVRSSCPAMEHQIQTKERTNVVLNCSCITVDTTCTICETFLSGLSCTTTLL